MTEDLVRVMRTSYAPHKLCKDVKGDLFEFISYPYLSDDGRIFVKARVPGDPTTMFTADALQLGPEGRDCFCSDAGEFYMKPEYYRERSSPWLPGEGGRMTETQVTEGTVPCLSEDCKRMLMRVRDHVLENPLRVDVTRWVMDEVTAVERGMKIPEGGTIACIAGWVVALNSARLNPLTVENKAQEFLGLTGGQAARLFYRMMWPHDLLIDSYDVVPQTREYAELVARRIDLFIASEGSI